MAACYPTEGDDGIFVEDGVINLTVDGLEISGIAADGETNLATGDGIHFDGVITDVVLKDNYIHDLDGNGVFFGAQPVEQTIGAIDIHGNMFNNNAGNGIEAGGFIVPAEYNSWGNEGGPAGTTNLIPGVIYAGDGISSGVDATPWTHVDVYLVASGTPWTGIPLNQVVSGQTITFTVMAHVVNTKTVKVDLVFPTNLSVNSLSNPLDSAFPAYASLSTTGNTVSFRGSAPFATPPTPITGNVELFSVTFTGDTPGADLDMDLKDLIDKFGMEGAGSSTNIYAAALIDNKVTVIDLPEITIVPVDAIGPYVAGIPIEFTIEVDNTDGGDFGNLNLDFSLPTGAVLQYWDGDSWETVVDPLTIGDLATDGIAFNPDLPLFRVIFPEPGPGTISVTLNDLAPTPLFPLDSDDHVFTLTGGFTLTGTFSMQGRSLREGIPVRLDYQTVAGFYADVTGETINTISFNLEIPGMNGGEWLVTTEQERYLNVVEGNQKVLLMNGNKLLPALQLLGGNAVWLNNNVIDLDDASQVGTDFGNPEGLDPAVLNGDVNFDGVVNVQDLALVGGNYTKTSESAYGIGNSAIWIIQ